MKHICIILIFITNTVLWISYGYSQNEKEALAGTFKPKQSQEILPVKIVDGIEEYHGYIIKKPPSTRSTASILHGGFYRLTDKKTKGKTLKISSGTWGEAKKYLGKKVKIYGNVVPGKGGPYLNAIKYKLFKRKQGAASKGQGLDD